MPGEPGRTRARFDEQAIAEDLVRLSAAGRGAIEAAREDFEHAGVPVDRLRACHGEHDSGTDLPGCVKVYIPNWGGDWRIVFQIAADEAGELLLSYIASGIGHQPRGARAPDVYQIAHHRLHGRWPRRARR